ncbi:MAG: WD40 repeat domain-containing protein [Gemmataceae bacterium]|nr:WD40 repeat domain-containing protein [Gemmataceae bacterium]
MSAKTLPLAVGLVLAGATPGFADESADLAAKARAVLTTHCGRCHGQDGAAEGGLNYAADLAKLVARKKVVAGDPDSSRLFGRMADGTMPPPDEQPRPSADEVAAVRKWIAAGAPAGAAPPPRAAVTPADTHAAILADLETIDRRARRFQRYFTLAHLHNAGLGADELQTYRNALSKLVNSLSWGSKVVRPAAVDPAGVVLRIDLRWYQWEAATWNRVLQEYPYGVLDDTIGSRAVSVATAARLPAVRADWFVATAGRAPLYYDLLQLPSTQSDLERLLRVDAIVNIRQDRIARAGFNGSGVSRFNRILERHDSAQGMYWRTYDFDEPPPNLAERAAGALVPDRRNVFAFPLGPADADTPFQHAGGEAIFALPNGLHGFYLAKADGTRLDKGPQAIVSDPRRPDRAVEAGVSCMGCHTTGILPKADQVRDHLGKNPGAFGRTDADRIKALYPPKEQTLGLMREDAERYAAAVAKAGAKVAKSEVVNVVTLRYEADLDLASAAAEVGLPPETLRERIVASDVLTKHVGALRAAGGTVGRAIWVQAFADVARELRLGAPYQPDRLAPALPDNTGDLDPLDGAAGGVVQAAFAADGRRAVLADGSRAVRITDVEGKRDLRRLTGHAAGVWSVALSPDEALALSGSLDGTARVWDLRAARESRVYSGHDSLVSAVAFARGGKWGVTGGFDGVLAAWKVGTGEEVWRVGGLGPVAAVAVEPAGGFVAVAAGKAVRLLDLTDGRELNRFDAGTPVSAVAVSPDGQRVVIGTEGGAVLVRGAVGGDVPQLDLTGHAGPVRAVAVRPGGWWAASAGADGTVRLWDLRTGKEAAVFRKHAGPVATVAFPANGRQTVSADRDGMVLPWAIDRFLVADPPKPPPAPKAPDTIPYAKE